MDDRHDLPFPNASRRRFLQAAAFAAAGAASVVVGPGVPAVTGQEPPEPLSDPGDCDCSDDGAVPLLAAAVVGGEYAALSATSEGPRLFSLAVNGDQTVTLGAPLSLATPQGFEPSALGVARGRFVVGGGLPFLWRSYQVDDQIDPIHVLGVAPAAFLANRALVEPIALPDMSGQVFATVGEVAETSQGTVVVMIEHAGGEPESWYANAVDVFEEVPGGWALRASARDLGESGPNRIVLDGDAIGVELTTSRGTEVIGAAAAQSATAARALPADILGDDELVSVVPVAGASGQLIAVGRRSARLVEEVARVL